MPKVKTDRFGAAASTAAKQDRKTKGNKSGSHRAKAMPGHRGAKLYVAIEQDTFDRLDDAINPERRKRRKRGIAKFDKGAVVEEALAAWLKKHGY